MEGTRMSAEFLKLKRLMIFVGGKLQVEFEHS